MHIQAFSDGGVSTFAEDVPQAGMVPQGMASPASSPRAGSRYGYGGSTKSRAEFRESVNHPSDDIIFHARVAAAGYTPKSTLLPLERGSGGSIAGLSRTVPTSPGIYASSVYRPAAADVRVVHDSRDSRVMYSVESASPPATSAHIRVVVPTHTVRAVYADAYESLRLGHPVAVLEEMLHFRPGLARQCDSNGVTLLHWACYYRSEPAVFELLLRVNPDAARRASQNDGCLPLHVAASWGCSVTVVALLFSAFPEGVNAADLWGNLPADKALQMGHNDIVPMLTPVEQAGGRPIAHRPGLFRRVMRDDLDDSRLGDYHGEVPASSGTGQRAPERTLGETGEGESAAWRQRPGSAPSSVQQRSNHDSSFSSAARTPAAEGASHRANDRSVAASKELRHELAAQRSAISHRLARLEHADSISAAERVNLQGALSAEKRRADKLQRQLDRMLSGNAGGSPPSSVKPSRNGSNNGAGSAASVDQSLADAFELSQSIDGTYIPFNVIVIGPIAAPSVQLPI
jgi:hypothetical protein